MGNRHPEKKFPLNRPEAVHGGKSIGVVCRTETEDRCKKDGDSEYPLRYLLLSVERWHGFTAIVSGTA